MYLVLKKKKTSGCQLSWKLGVKKHVSNDGMPGLSALLLESSDNDWTACEYVHVLSSNPFPSFPYHEIENAYPGQSVLIDVYDLDISFIKMVGWEKI